MSTRAKDAASIAEEKIHREARKILRKLGVARTRLVCAGDDKFAVRRAGDKSRAARTLTSAAMVQAFLGRGWLAQREHQSYALTEAGAFWLKRSLAEDGSDAFADQHRVIERRAIAGADGKPALVRVNQAESPLTRLYVRGRIDAAQFEAGERLRRDFTLAQMTPRLTADLSAPLVKGLRAAKPENLSDTVIAAKQRFSRAMAAVGPQLSDLLYSVCCDLKTLDEAETGRAWPKRSAGVVLTLALDTLAGHYGIGKARASAPITGWRAETGS